MKMGTMKFRKELGNLLHHADVRINGDRPWDPQVKDEQFYTWLFAKGSLGLGESYMAGHWECEQLDEMIARVLRNDVSENIKRRADTFHILKARLMNLQSRNRAYEVGEKHYDIGNDLYEKMLDRNMIYSCGYWKKAGSLEEAQENKHKLVCRKLDVQPGMKVLDIGCGWGGTARYIAEHCGAEVTGVTISKEQAATAKEKCRDLPVHIRQQDYRTLEEVFDRVLSIGMFEHVGYKNYRTYMRVVRRLLKDDGLFLLHTIGNNKSVNHTERWIHKYIFPNSMLPSAKQICKAAEGYFVLEDWHNFGPDYDKTMVRWFENFDSNYSALLPKYDEQFYRMWRYYLLTCAGSFRARKNQVWQIIFSPKGRAEGYERPVID